MREGRGTKVEVREGGLEEGGDGERGEDMVVWEGFSYVAPLHIG